MNKVPVTPGRQTTGQVSQALGVGREHRCLDWQRSVTRPLLTIKRHTASVTASEPTIR